MPMIQVTDTQLADLQALALRGEADLTHYLREGNPEADGYTVDEAGAMRALAGRSDAVLTVLGFPVNEELSAAPDQAQAGILHVLHTNYDYNESATLHPSLAAACEAIRRCMEIEMPITDPAFCDEVTEAYEADDWKGLSLSRVNTNDGTLEIVSPDEIRTVAEVAA